MRHTNTHTNYKRKGERETLAFTAVILLFALSLFLMPTVSAEKITTTEISFPEGFTILEAQQEYIQTNHNFTYNFFLYNSSDGEIKTSDDGVNCSMFIVDSYGELLLNESVNSDITQGYWYLEIDKSVFSYSGEYSYGVSCYNGVGGALAGTFNSSPTGLSGTVLFYIIVMIFSIAVVIIGFKLEDPWIVILGGFSMVLVGLFTIIFGIGDIKNTVYTYGIGIIITMLGAYFGIRSAIEGIVD